MFPLLFHPFLPDLAHKLLTMVLCLFFFFVVLVVFCTSFASHIVLVYRFKGVVGATYIVITISSRIPCISMLDSRDSSALILSGSFDHASDYVCCWALVLCIDTSSPSFVVSVNGDLIPGLNKISFATTISVAYIL